MTATATASPQQSAPAAGLRGASRRVDLPALIVTLVLLAGFFRGWSQGSLSAPVTVFHLKLVVPTLPWLDLSWGWILLVGWLLALAGSLTRRRALLWAGAVLTLTVLVGFVVLTASVGGERVASLAADRTNLTVLSKTMGYTVLRPNVTVLGPFPISRAASLVLSSLRSGFFITAVCAGLLLWRALVLPRSGPVPAGEEDGAAGRSAWPSWRSRSPMLALLPALLVVWGLVGAAIAAGQVSRAVQDSQRGHYSAALSRVQSAKWFNSAPLADPDRAEQLGAIELATGRVSDAEAQLASSRQQVVAGHPLDALRTLGAASDRWPGNKALRDELVTQSIAYVRTREDPWLVRTLVPSRDAVPVLSLVLAKYELDGGDAPTALIDARAAVAATSDKDIKSAALTLESVALTRTGDDRAGRTSLLAAIAVDSDHVNVMARSIAAGLYTSVQP